MANYNYTPARDVAAAEAAFRAGEAAERAYEDAYSAHPGVGLDGAAQVRDPAGDYSLVSDGSGAVGAQSPVQYVDPVAGSGGRFGGGS